MKKIFFLGLITALILSNCKKEDDKNFIIAGNSQSNTSFILNFEDSIPTPVYEDFSDGGWNSSPLNVDANDDLEIRINCTWQTYKGEFLQKAFSFKSNIDEIEFAVSPKDTIIDQDIPLFFVKVFDENESISDKEVWMKGVSQALFLSLYYLKNDRVYTFNKGLTDKFIGIRKNINGKLVYGWVKFKLIGHDKLIISESMFNN